MDFSDEEEVVGTVDVGAEDGEEDADEAPAADEDEVEVEAEPEDEESEEEAEEDELDLEAVLRELEEELNEADEEDEETEEEDPVTDESKEESTEKAPVAEAEDTTEDETEADDEEEAKEEEAEEAESTEAEAEVVSEETEEVDEEIDLEEVIKALRETDDVDESKEAFETKIAGLEKDIAEHRDVVQMLRSKLNEVNLLNSKLLFTNKLFRAYGLNNEQKMKVVETFDRAKNLREVKLVFTTMAESFGTKTSTDTIKESTRKGTASKAVASTKSEKQEEIISEGSDVKARFQKLANIL